MNWDKYLNLDNPEWFKKPTSIFEEFGVYVTPKQLRDIKGNIFICWSPLELKFSN